MGECEVGVELAGVALGMGVRDEGQGLGCRRGSQVTAACSLFFLNNRNI